MRAGPAMVIVRWPGLDKIKIDVLKPVRSKGRIMRNYTGILHYVW